MKTIETSQTRNNALLKGLDCQKYGIAKVTNEYRYSDFSAYDSIVFYYPSSPIERIFHYMNSGCDFIHLIRKESELVGVVSHKLPKELTHLVEEIEKVLGVEMVCYV